MRHTGMLIGAAALLLAAMGAAQGDMTFLDHRGKTITLKEPPKRIVSMFASGPLVHAAVEGTTEHFVGVNVKGKKTYSNSIYAELMPELLKLNFDVAGEGFAPNVEAILALKPDAVLQWTFDPKIIEPLERVNLTVIGWDCCTKEQRRDYLRLAGYTANRIDRAQTILALQDKSENALRDLFAKAKLDKPATMLVIDQVKEGVQVIANSSQDYSLSGTNNLAADNTGEWWRTIDAEQLLVWNPQIIVIPAYATDLKPADIYGNAMFASIDAVKNKRVYKFPQFNRSPDSAEIYLSDDWLARVAHPDLFKGDKFAGTVKDSYKLIYLKDVTDDQLKSILEIEQNKDSAGYSDIFG
ncbi:ABC transporter substrate-binding protein [Dongia sedimenti]|uniref:ABC transporter substrate-binding protein n=1 Tax=Dongia sedimenti TaxID=3064282 RepID=A0ABU0YJL8_9PROT|nr:ABC transporter substrate-binding protein [Rhodospirillaceae bacterium R-7]